MANYGAYNSFNPNGGGWGAPKKKAPTAAAGGSYAPPGVDTNLPLDPLYGLTVAGIDASTANSLGDITSQQTADAARYGYTTATDANGNVSITGVDPNNPFSLANQLTKSYNQQVAGNTNGYASRGQLYAGSLQNAQNASADNYSKGQNTLQSNFQDDMRGLLARRHDIENTATTSKLAALSTSVTNAANNPTATNPDYVAGDTPAQTRWRTWLRLHNVQY